MCLRIIVLMQMVKLFCVINHHFLRVQDILAGSSFLINVQPNEWGTEVRMHAEDPHQRQKVTPAPLVK